MKPVVFIYISHRRTYVPVIAHGAYEFNDFSVCLSRTFLFFFRIVHVDLQLSRFAGRWSPSLPGARNWPPPGSPTMFFTTFRRRARAVEPVFQVMARMDLEVFRSGLPLQKSFFAGIEAFPSSGRGCVFTAIEQGKVFEYWLSQSQMSTPAISFL